MRAVAPWLGAGRSFAWEHSLTWDGGTIGTVQPKKELLCKRRSDKGDTDGTNWRLQDALLDLTRQDTRYDAVSL
jgi:hypothetical protein